MLLLLKMSLKVISGDFEFRVLEIWQKCYPWKGICVGRGTEDQSKIKQERCLQHSFLCCSPCCVMLWQFGGMETGVSSVSQNCEYLRARAKSTVSTTSCIPVPRTLMQTGSTPIRKKIREAYGKLLSGGFLNTPTLKSNLGMIQQSHTCT